MYGDEPSCQQVPRARHLWTLCVGEVGGVGGVGGVWEVGEVGGDSSLQEIVLTTLNQSKNPQAQALLMEYRCVLFSEHTVVVVTYVRSLASTYLPCSVALAAATMLAYGDRRQGFGAPSSSTRLCSEPSQNAWRSLNSQFLKY